MTVGTDTYAVTTVTKSIDSTGAISETTVGLANSTNHLPFGNITINQPGNVNVVPGQTLTLTLTLP